ncbi:MAG: hypothetical protein H6909_04580 [Rickettsiaceae bacterium]|nr:hypothetical protein [Rickettsiaceae bacterium]
MTCTNHNAPIDYITRTVLLATVSLGIGAGIHCILMDKDIKELKKPIKIISMTSGAVGGSIVLGGLGGGFVALLLSAANDKPSVGESIKIISGYTLIFGVIGGLIGLIGGATCANMSYKIAEFLTDNIKLPIGNTSINIVGGINHVGFEWSDNESLQVATDIKEDS